MKHLFNRLAKLAQIVLLVAILALVAGVPPIWVGYIALFVLDFAAIAWVGNDSKGGGKRARMPIPHGALGILSSYATPTSFGFF